MSTSELSSTSDRRAVGDPGSPPVVDLTKPAAPPPAVPARDRLLGLVPALRAVLGIWLASRIAVLLVSLVGARVVRNPRVARIPDLLTMWDRWDSQLYIKVARFGYFSPAYQDRTEAFFPGQPLAIRAVHLVVRDWVAAGMVVSLLAGLVACAALWRLAADEGGPAAGRRAVLAMVLFPYAVFLFAGYSEALFLAFALPAWLAARRGRWELAGLLACGATATRVTGLALLAALWVQYLVSARRPGAGRRTWWRVVKDLPWLALPAAPPLAFLTYLRVRTGHWDAYTRAEAEGWSRHVQPPWKGLQLTWHAAVNPYQVASLQWFWWAAIVAMAIATALTVALAVARRWGEATYVGLSVLVLTSSSFWGGGTLRGVLVAFPLFLWLARRRESVLTAYVWVSAPLMAIFVLVFTNGTWVD
jgi:hypothetical protein